MSLFKMKSTCIIAVSLLKLDLIVVKNVRFLKPNLCQILGNNKL